MKLKTKNLKLKTLMIALVPLVLGMAMFVAAAASGGGGYVPVPAPNPMYVYDVNEGETVHGFFNIEDASGPVGMTIVFEPNELVITSMVISPIADFNDARRYTFYFDYTAGENSETVLVKSYDTKNRLVTNSLVFNVLEDALHVFTGAGEVTEPNEPVSGIWWNNVQRDMRDTSRGNLVFHYNGVVEGKWGLSPKYANLDALEDLIAKYDNPSYVTMQGHLIEN